MLMLDDQKLPVEQQAKLNVDLDLGYAKFRDETRFWIQRVAVPLLMVIGLFGNSITVIIMTRRRMRSTTNMYLAALAFVDMLYLILTFLLGLSHYPNMAGYKYHLYWRLRPFLMMLTDACSNTSVWLTVTFTIERYIAVKFPIKGKVWCTESRAKSLIIFVFIFGIVFASPVPFEWKVVEKKVSLPSAVKNDSSATGLSSLNQTIYVNQSENSFLNEIPHHVNKLDTFDPPDSQYRDILQEDVLLTLENTDFGRNETYKTIYYWSTAVIFYFIPLFSLMLFNGFLIKSVHQSQKERSRMTRRSAPSSLVINTSTPSCPSPSHSCEIKQLHPQKDLARDDVTTCISSSSLNHDSGSESTQDRLPKSILLHATHLKYNQTSSAGESMNSLDRAQIEPLMTNQCQSGDEKLYPLNGPSKIYKTDSLSSSLVDSNHGAMTNSKNEHEVHGNRLTAIGLNLATQVASDGIDPISSKGKESGQTSISTLVSKLNNKCPKGAQRTAGSSPIRSTPSKRITSQAGSGSSQHSASTQERRITIMLIAVVILFLVCQIPSAAMLLYTSVREIVPNTNEHALVLAFGNIFNFLMAINAAGNFILYSFLSKKYRKTFMILFCCCLGTKQTTQAGANRTTSVRFDNSTSAQKNQTSIYHYAKPDKLARDTLV